MTDECLAVKPDAVADPLLTRAPIEDVAASRMILTAAPIVSQMLDGYPEPALVLNAHRQMVTANDKLITLVGMGNDQLLGLRPGEILHCIHAKTAGSCGTSEFCTPCGAAKALADSARYQTAQVQDCSITQATPDGSAAMDLRVWATPLAADRRFTVFAIRDVTDEKRRAVLERIFFHDILNTAGGLKGIVDLLPDLGPQELPGMGTLAGYLAAELIEEIRFHRDLVAAERGDLPVWLRKIDVEHMLDRLWVVYRYHTVAAGKKLAAPTIEGPKFILSDEVLLGRILGNLIKNALEASLEDQTVTVSFRNNGAPVFSVHNESFMPPAIQMQIFQRSFSTKATVGRGIGTYSVKLLTERYLHGQVGFESARDRGTTFTVKLRPDQGSEIPEATRG